MSSRYWANPTTSRFHRPLADFSVLRLVHHSNFLFQTLSFSIRMAGSCIFPLFAISMSCFSPVKISSVLPVDFAFFPQWLPWYHFHVCFESPSSCRWKPVAGRKGSLSFSKVLEHPAPCWLSDFWFCWVLLNLWLLYGHRQSFLRNDAPSTLKF